MLKDLIKNISSWLELEAGIAGLPTEYDRGQSFEEFCLALRQIAEKHEDVVIVYPVHLNPNVQKPVYNIYHHYLNTYFF